MLKKSSHQGTVRELQRLGTIQIKLVRLALSAWPMLDDSWLHGYQLYWLNFAAWPFMLDVLWLHGSRITLLNFLAWLSMLDDLCLHGHQLTSLYLASCAASSHLLFVCNQLDSFIQQFIWLFSLFFFFSGLKLWFSLSWGIWVHMDLYFTDRGCVCAGGSVDILSFLEDSL